MIVIGKNDFYTSERDISDHILLNHYNELQKAVQGTIDHKSLIDMILSDYGWTDSRGFGREARIAKVVNKLLGVYGKDALYTSEAEITRHVLAKHGDNLKVPNLRDRIMKDYGWSNGFLSSFRKEKIERAIQRATVFLKLQQCSNLRNDILAGIDPSNRYSLLKNQEISLFKEYPTTLVPKTVIRVSTLSDKDVARWDKMIGKNLVRLKRDQEMVNNLPFRARSYIDVDKQTLLSRIQAHLPKMRQGAEALLSNESDSQYLRQEANELIDLSKNEDFFSGYRMEDVAKACRDAVIEMAREEKELRSSLNQLINLKDPKARNQAINNKLNFYRSYFHKRNFSLPKAMFNESIRVLELDLTKIKQKKLTALKDRLNYIYTKLKNQNSISLDRHIEKINTESKVKSEINKYIVQKIRSFKLRNIQKEIPSFQQDTVDIVAEERSGERKELSFRGETFKVLEAVEKDISRDIPDIILDQTRFIPHPSDTAEIKIPSERLAILKGLRKRAQYLPNPQELEDCMFLSMTQTLRNRAGPLIHEVAIDINTLIAKNAYIATYDPWQQEGMDRVEFKICKTFIGLPYVTVDLTQQFKVAYDLERKEKASKRDELGRIQVKSQFEIRYDGTHWNIVGPFFKEECIKYYPAHS